MSRSEDSQLDRPRRRSVLARGAAGLAGVAGTAAAVDILRPSPAAASTATATPDWINVTVSPYNADDAGGGDAAGPINLAIAAASTGQTVYLPAGTYRLNGSAYLTLAVRGLRLVGDGPGATTIQIGPSFTGSQAVLLGAEGCAIENLTIAGLTPGTGLDASSNPAADAIGLNGQRFCRVTDVSFAYINGWCVNSVANGSDAGYATMLTRLSTYQNCAGGIHIQGVSATGNNYGAQHFLTDCNMQHIGVGAGPKAGLDAWRFEDAFDIIGANFNGAISSNSHDATNGYGVCMRIVGHCASIFLTNMDLGADNDTANRPPVQNPVWLIQDKGGVAPDDIKVTNAIGQQGGIGLQITGGAKNVRFVNFTAQNNGTHGISVEGTGTSIDFDGVHCDGNGSGGTGTNYDFQWTSTATGLITGAVLKSSVVTAGTSTTPNAGVQNPAHFAGGVNGAIARDWQCIGSGATASNVFDITPPSGDGTPAIVHTPAIVRGVAPWNPRGAASVAFPASGGAVTPVSGDRTYYFTAGGADVTCKVTGAAAFSIKIPAGTTLPVFVPAQQTISLTYVSTPTQPPGWVVYGH